MSYEVRLHRPGTVAYRDAWRWQQETAAAVRDGAPEALALLQHAPVYTLGRRARPENLLLAPETLALRGADVIETDRGGDVTFHGPGQLVAYPILDLRARGLGPADYVRLLEETMILTAERFGIAAQRSPGRPGVWATTPSSPLSPGGKGLGRGAAHPRRSPVPRATHRTREAPQPLSSQGEGRAAAGVRPAKLGAVGVRVQGGVTLHGLALNLDVDLSWFDAIVPCGLPGVCVTSLQRLLGHNPGIAAVEAAFIAAFELVFDSSAIASQSAAARGEAISEQPPNRESAGFIPQGRSHGDVPELVHGR